MCLLNTHASTHPQDQRWGRWEPNSSQVGFERRPLTPPHPHGQNREGEREPLQAPISVIFH